MSENTPAIRYLAMTRSLCYGSCPAYSFRITAEGDVFYYGQAFVIQEGEHHWKIPEPRMRALAKIIAMSGFFTEKLPIGETMPDVPTIDLMVKLVDGRSRGVCDMSEWRLLDRVAKRIDANAGLYGYAYQPLSRYMLSAEREGTLYQHFVHARDGDDARQIVNRYLQDHGSSAERTLPASAWQAKHMGLLYETYPASEGRFIG